MARKRSRERGEGDEDAPRSPALKAPTVAVPPDEAEPPLAPRAAPRPTIERAMSLANLAETPEPRDFTDDVPQEHRRLDALARLLRFQTTTCAAVAITPGDDRRIVLAMNTLDDETIRRSKALFNALRDKAAQIRAAAQPAHAAAPAGGEAVAMPEHERILSVLFNKLKKFDYVVNIVDNAGRTQDFEQLKRYYAHRRAEVAAKGDSTSDDGREMAMFFNRQIELIDNRTVEGNLATLIRNELTDNNSRYHDFLIDDHTVDLVERNERDIAKITELFEGATEFARVFQGAPRNHPFIIVSPTPDIATRLPQDVVFVPMFAEGEIGLKTIHAETQLAAYFILEHGIDDALPVRHGILGAMQAVEDKKAAIAARLAGDYKQYLPDYIGISMACCRMCSACMNVLYAGTGKLAYRADSIATFPNVAVAESMRPLIAGAGVALDALERVRDAVPANQEQKPSVSPPDGRYAGVATRLARHTGLAHATRYAVRGAAAARMAPAADVQPVQPLAPPTPNFRHVGGTPGGRDHHS